MSELVVKNIFDCQKCKRWMMEVGNDELRNPKSKNVAFCLKCQRYGVTELPDEVDRAIADKLGVGRLMK